MTFEEKAAEFREKWRTRYEQSSVKDFYKFYRINCVELFNDLEELDLLCKKEKVYK
jgi:hypothetical protein